jgi:hypothetical protein
MRSIALAGLVALAAGLGIAAAPGAASATASATASAAPSSARSVAASPRANELFGVSCVSPKDCLAVGEDRNAPTALAETWSTTWKSVSVKLPPGATRAALGGVTCRSAKDCLAVGFYLKGINQYVLADTWNGRAWSPVTLPGAAGDSTGANGISCPTARNCVAVGGYTAGAGAHALADMWNGKWTEAKPPAPKGSVLSALASVSCTSATFCVAVGLYFTNTGGGVLIDSWNGKSWSLMQGLVPRGSLDSVLTGVSCVTAKNCFAVGYASGTKGLTSLAERWNGKKWALTSVPWPRGTTNPALTDVSCPAANRCVAVGTIDPNLNGASNTGRAAATTWNGKAWTATPVAAPGRGKASLFNGVTCLSTKDCVAVGQLGPANSTNGTGLSGFWNARSWRLVAAQ